MLLLCLKGSCGTPALRTLNILTCVVDRNHASIPSTHATHHSPTSPLFLPLSRPILWLCLSVSLECALASGGVFLSSRPRASGTGSSPRRASHPPEGLATREWEAEEAEAGGAGRRPRTCLSARSSSPACWRRVADLETTTISQNNPN